MMDLTREARHGGADRRRVHRAGQPVLGDDAVPGRVVPGVPRTGLDTLFAVAWADLDQEPLVLSVPDTGGRYYVFALFDLWSNVFASIGSAPRGPRRRAS